MVATGRAPDRQYRDRTDPSNWTVAVGNPADQPWDRQLWPGITNAARRTARRGCHSDNRPQYQLPPRYSFDPFGLSARRMQSRSTATSTAVARLERRLISLVGERPSKCAVVLGDLVNARKDRPGGRGRLPANFFDDDGMEFVDTLHLMNTLGYAMRRFQAPPKMFAPE